MGRIRRTLGGALLFACLVPAAPPFVSPAERAAQLEAEPVGSIRLAFQAEDPRLYWTRVYDKQAVDEEISIMLVEAAPLMDGQRTGYLTPDRTQSRFGVFAVSGPGNRVESVLGVFRPPFEYPTPVLEPPTRDSVYVHWHGSYGVYVATTRFRYHPRSRRRAERTVYGRFQMTFVAAEGPRLYYRASFENHAPGRLQTQNAGLIFDSESREFTITATPPEPPGPPRRLPRFAEGLLPEGVTPAQAIQNGYRPRGDLFALATERGLFIYTPRGPRQHFVHPPAAREKMEAARPDLATRSTAGASAFQPNANFGPLALRGNTLWFATRFYDGEGQSGVGALGNITLGRREVYLRYLPEMACCSGSALYVEPEGEEILYAGLASYTEGAAIGRGLLRYNAATGEARHFAIPDVISGIRRAGAALAIASEHGLYLLENGSLAHYRLEPAAGGGARHVAFSLARP